MVKRDGVFERSDRAGWYVSYVDAEGKRRKERVQAHTRQQAMTILSAIKTRVEREKVLGIKVVSEITTEELFIRFMKHQKPHIKAATYNREEGILAAMVPRLPRALKDVTKEKVAAFVGERSGEVKAATVQKELSVLKHALRMAVEWELRPTNPAANIRQPKTPEGRTRYLSPAELKAALSNAPAWLRPVLALAAFTGMRRGEVLGLRWTDIDGQRAYLRDTKNGSLRIVPLNDLALAVIGSLPRSGSKLFSGFTAQNVSVSTRRLFAKLGMEDASFHSLRHTAASWLVMQGVDLYAVGQVLGHKTPRMTTRYAHLSPAYMANAVSQLDTALAGVLDAGDAVETLGTKPLTAIDYTPRRLTTKKTRVDIGHLRRSAGLARG